MHCCRCHHRRHHLKLVFGVLQRLLDCFCGKSSVQQKLMMMTMRAVQMMDALLWQRQQ
jgi:hypothetical protein